jgi:hypothetical protein
MPRSKPPRSTSTRSPKPTKRTSTPSPARAAGDGSPTDVRRHPTVNSRRGPGMLDPADEAPVQEILPTLELDHQYTRLVEAWNHELVTQIRRCGREAGKRLGYKIQTLTSDRSSGSTDESQSGSRRHQLRRRGSHPSEASS